MTRLSRGTAALLLGLAAAACSRSEAREYELNGQILAVNSARQEVTIKHEDIPRFMPGMTMPFRVERPELLEGRVPGDLVKGTLVVDGGSARLTALERVGFSPVAPADLPPPPLREPGEMVTGATFLNQDGVQRRLDDWRGHAVAVTFIYTRCPVPDFCPLMDRHFQAAQEQIRDDRTLAGGARLLSVTIDPAYDTPAVLARHAALRKADGRIWEFLTPVEGAKDFAGQFGLSTYRSDPDGPDVMHNLRTPVIDREGRLVTILNGNEWTPDDLIAALRKALGAE